ncbi:zinc ribbon domain-containing protein [Streptomyces sp. MZ04]|uniref:zinc ribbon domain-containing protein n=1 Tax=Streptomyces sp. MZ04 TaxID=2559236 RepID=UPI00107E6FC6|nr:zinc ribbon domain-containing protein [Streptomyces sp. MZ04]TGB03231.1 hypothetical protein E2651_25735 [Streptomyces sp. MZ04]
MSDSVQQWDDILADLLVECGHCHGPMSPLPAGAAEPAYECLQKAHDKCTQATMPALELEDYVAHQVLGEMAKPAVADALTQALLTMVETDLSTLTEDLATRDALDGVPAEQIEARRRELHAERRTLNRFMDEDTFSPRWLAEWWDHRAAEAPHRKRQLCASFFTRIELLAGPAPEPDALYDDRVVLHWKTWDDPAGGTGPGGTQ